MMVYSNNPFWAVMNDKNGGWNTVGVILGALSLVILSISDRKKKVDAHDDKDKLSVAAARTGVQTKYWFHGAAGFGAWIFVIHNFFTDSSILSRWTWDGYPSTGPAPVPWGGLVVTALILGFSIGRRVDLTTGMIWWAVAAVCAAIITFVSGWMGHIAGLIFAVYISSITPAVLKLVSQCPPGKTLGIGFMIYNMLVLASIYTVAYEFVPGGPLLRERTWVVMLVTMWLLFLGVRGARSVLEKEDAWPLKKNTAENNEFSRQNRSGRGIMWILGAVGWFVMFWRMTVTTKVPEPFNPKERIITSAIWTIHFDIDNDLWTAEQRILEAVQDLKPDVMGFLESDTERIIMGNRDWTQYLGEKLGYYVDYGPSPRKHTWGCAMLSKFPIKKSEHLLLPSPAGELACAIYATLDVHGRDVDVIISHNGQEENLLDRQLQTTKLAEVISASKNPFIFTGYVVTKPFGEIYNILIDGGKINDVDPTDHDRWCQYIAYKGLKRVAYARISRGTITDTEIQAAKFVVPEPGVAISDWKPSYDRVEESHYSPAYHFPAIFRGSGVRGHYYHVFDEPRYYN
ncbi:Protein cwh43 [Zancudomyces culisetae]|uniref:Protein cwh43 n=1 Tax=Zancudomyces culisetae TaxID=1213189 RepID=A0A1R1PZH8_ZANCU|nr:Protein cwh43 [Zancudomyces culisetae]|eukprot:OMH86327.1 Protein cwh43 [Zancudomyces culisetae]